MQSEKYGSEECWKDAFSFLVETMETAVKSWHETSKVDARVYFLLDKEKTDTEKYAPVVNIDKVPTFLPAFVSQIAFSFFDFLYDLITLCGFITSLLLLLTVVVFKCIN